MSIPHVPDEGPPVDVTALIRQVNASNEAIEDLYLRTRQAADIAKRSQQAAEQAAVVAETAKIAHRIIQAEHSQRRAPLPRQPPGFTYPPLISGFPYVYGPGLRLCVWLRGCGLHPAGAGPWRAAAPAGRMPGTAGGYLE